MSETPETFSVQADDIRPLPWASSVDAPTAPYGTVCFVCHRTFGTGIDRTEEDVVPKWVLRHLNLTTAGADLPTGQVFRYTQRKVPCCWDCNQRMSRDLELPVSAAFRAGYDAVTSMDATTLYLWLAKVYYGTRFRETGLRTDIKNPDSAVMLEHTELLARNEHLRRCLMHSPADLAFANPPGSVLLFRAGTPAATEDQFDLMVPTFASIDAIFIRVGGTLAMCVFGDNGHWARRFGSIQLVEAAKSDLVLHPAQCVELMMWLTSELAGHDSYGCYDLLTTLAADGSPQSVLLPQFTVERNDVPQEAVNVARVKGMAQRLRMPATPELLASAAAGRFPTLLLNVPLDDLVQADCFELDCPGLLNRAAWQVDGAFCSVCGEAPRPADETPATIT